jgi:deoxyribonuclease-4
MKLGLHISTAGNLVTTPERAREMTADTIQIFASNPRGWRPTHYDEATAKAFREACLAAKIDPVWIHMIYLVSYGNIDDEQRNKSIVAMRDMLDTADLLGVKGVVTHMGSHKGLGFAQALGRITDSYTQVLEGGKDSLLILENSAGAGGNIGNSLEELAAMIDAIKGHKRMAICIDTAHALTSGYEIRTKEGLDDFLDQFDRLIGLDRLVVMHLNDSKADIGSHIDRHENIGDGFIGLDGFRNIINHPKLAHVSGVMEVPGLEGKGPDKANLDRLRKLLVA